MSYQCEAHCALRYEVKELIARFIFNSTDILQFICCNTYITLSSNNHFLCENISDMKKYKRTALI